MKEIITKVYTYDELSDEAKEKARDWWSEVDDYDGSELKASLDAFEKIFPINVTDWGYGSGHGSYVSWEFTGEDEVKELSGWRLATYIWNNYRWYIFKGKYYSNGKWVDGKYSHKERRSKIQLENDCILTGVCFDHDILDPIYKFLEKPDKQDFEDLLNDCLQSWAYAGRDEMESRTDTDYIEDAIFGNEYTFTEDGERMG